MEIHNKVEKIYMKNTDCGDLGIPEIQPVQTLTSKLMSTILTVLVSCRPRELCGRPLRQPN